MAFFTTNTQTPIQIRPHAVFAPLTQWLRTVFAKHEISGDDALAATQRREAARAKVDHLLR